MASGRVLCWTQHLWQPSAPLTSAPSLCLLFFSCVYIFLFVYPPSFPAFQGSPVLGVMTNTEKVGKMRTLMPLDRFPLPAPISITATSASPKVARSSKHLAPPPCFLRSVGSICLKTSPSSASDNKSHAEKPRQNALITNKWWQVQSIKTSQSYLL